MEQSDDRLNMLPAEADEAEDGTRIDGTQNATYVEALLVLLNDSPTRIRGFGLCLIACDAHVQVPYSLWGGEHSGNMLSKSDNVRDDHFWCIN